MMAALFGACLVVLGVTMLMNRAGYVLFIIRPSTVLWVAAIGGTVFWLSYAHAIIASPIDSAADATYCLRNGGQPTFANGRWDKCRLPSPGETRAAIYLPVRDLGDAALCTLAGGKVTMRNGDWDNCAIP